MNTTTLSLDCTPAITSSTTTYKGSPFSSWACQQHQSLKPCASIPRISSTSLSAKFNTVWPVHWLLWDICLYPFINIYLYSVSNNLTNHYFILFATWQFVKPFYSKLITGNSKFFSWKCLHWEDTVCWCWRDHVLLEDFKHVMRWRDRLPYIKWTDLASSERCGTKQPRKAVWGQGVGSMLGDEERQHRCGSAVSSPRLCAWWKIQKSYEDLKSFML